MGGDARQSVPSVDKVQECSSPFYCMVDGPGRGLEKTGLELGDTCESQGEAEQAKECHSSATQCFLFVVVWLLTSWSKDAKDDIGRSHRPLTPSRRNLFLVTDQTLL